MRTLLFFALFASVLSAAFYSWADSPPSIDLTWQAPSGCPSAASVEREVERLLGRATDRGDRLVATAVVTPSERGWLVVLTTKLRGVDGRRVVEARSCEALSKALAIVLALTIDPSRSSQVVGGPSDAAAVAVASLDASEGSLESSMDASGDALVDALVDVTPTSVDGGPVGRAPVVSTAVDAPTEFSLGAGFATNVGPLPRVAFAPELMGGWRYGRFRLDLAFAYFPAVRSLLDATRGGDFALATGALRACNQWRSAGLTVGPCLAIEGGAMTGEGVGVRSLGSDVAPWLAARAGALGSVRLGTSAIRLLLSAEAAVPMFRYRFQLDAVGIVHQPSAVAGRASFGGEVRF